jgi:hypothetical protein
MTGWWDARIAAAFAAGLTATCGRPPALADEQQPLVQACGGDEIARGMVRRILDGRTFVLDDGREVRLAAIEVPTLAGPQNAAFAPKAAAAALDALAGGDEVVLRRAESGSTVYFAVTDASGKLVSLSVKVTPDSVHAAMSPSADVAPDTNMRRHLS